jgi:hypothetical protein
VAGGMGSQYTWKWKHKRRKQVGGGDRLFCSVCRSVVCVGRGRDLFGFLFVSFFVCCVPVCGVGSPPPLSLFFTFLSWSVGATGRASLSLPPPCLLRSAFFLSTRTHTAPFQTTSATPTNKQTNQPTNQPTIPSATHQQHPPVAALSLSLKTWGATILF